MHSVTKSKSELTVKKPLSSIHGKPYHNITSNPSTKLSLRQPLQTDIRRDQKSIKYHPVRYNSTSIGYNQHLHMSSTTPFSSNRSLDAESRKSTIDLLNALKSMVDRKVVTSSHDRKKLAANIFPQIPRMTASELCQTIWYVGTLRLSPRSDDILSLSDMIIDRLSAVRALVTAADITMAFIGFARLGIRLSQAATKSFLDGLPQWLESMDDHQTANTVWSLGKIAVMWYSLPLKSQKAIGGTISRTCQQMTPQGVANTIQGLSNMGAQWENLPSYLKTALLDSLKSKINSMKEQEVSNCISGLGRLGVEWDKFPIDIRRLILSAIQKCSKDLNNIGLAMTIHGLGKMNVDIIELPLEFRNNLYMSIIKFAGTINSQEVSNIVYGLGKMNSHQRAKDFTPEEKAQNGLLRKARDALFDAIHRESWQMTAQGISNTLWGLMLLQVQWLDLKDDLKRNLIMAVIRECSRMSEQEFGNTFYSLGKLQMTWSALSEQARWELLNCLESKCSTMTSAGVVMTLLGIGRLKIPWDEISVQVKRAIFDASVNALQISNDESVSIVIHALATSGAQWENFGPKLQTAIEESIVRSQWISATSSSNQSVKAEFLPSKVSKPAKSSNRNHNHKKFPIPISAYNASVLSITIDNVIESKVLQSKMILSRRAGDDTSQANPYHLIHSLGLLHAKWEALSFSTKTTLLNILTSNIDRMDERSVVNAFDGLSNTGLKWIDLRSNVKQKLLSALLRICDDLVEQGISIIILALAKLDVCWQDDLPDILKASIRRSIARQTHLGEHSLSSLLYGLGKLSRKWDDLHPEVRQTLKAAIVVCHIDGKITPEGVSNAVYGLGLLKTDWTSLSSSVRLALLGDITEIIHHTSERKLVNILSGLGRMNADWRQLPRSLTMAIEFQLSVRIPTMSDQHIASLLSAYSSLGLEWFDISSSTREAILNRLSQLYSTDHSLMNADDFVLPTLFGSMARVGMKWHYVDVDNKLTEIMLSRFHESLVNASFSQTAQIIFSLGRMGCRWETLSNELRQRVLKKFPVVFTPTNYVRSDMKDVSVFIHGLGTLGQVWDNLMPSFQDSIFRWTSHIGMYGQISEIAGLVFGLGLMDCSWTKLPSTTSKILIDNICRIAKLVTRDDMSLTGSKQKYWGYSFGKSRWISHQLRNNVSRQSASSEYQAVLRQESQSFANLMYGLSLMIFDVNESTQIEELTSCHLTLLEVVSQFGIPRFSPEEREQIAIYIHLLQTVVDVPALNSSKSGYLIMSSSRVDQQTTLSRLQQSVVTALSESLKQRSDDLEVKNEYSAFGGIFPVDVTVFEGNNPVAFVEVDGPQHFRDGGILRRKDLLKETMYKSKHPRAAFTRVRYDQVNRLGSRYVGYEMANFISIVRSHQQCCTDSKDISKNQKTLDDWSHNCELNGFITRNAERELRLSLEGQYENPSFRRHHVRTFDFVFADVEEDNS